jgi:hypothetical protein
LGDLADQRKHLQAFFKFSHVSEISGFEVISAAEEGVDLYG